MSELEQRRPRCSHHSLDREKNPPGRSRALEGPGPHHDRKAKHNMKTIEQLHAARKRWMTRLVRATNEVRWHDQQIARLEKPKAAKPKLVAVTEPKPKVTETTDVTELNPYFQEAMQPVEIPVISTDDPNLVEKVAAALERSRSEDIPKVLDRRDPVVKAELEAAREAAKKKMPLNEKEARDYIRKRSIAVEKKREKRDRAFFKK